MRYDLLDLIVLLSASVFTITERAPVLLSSRGDDALLIHTHTDLLLISSA